MKQFIKKILVFLAIIFSVATVTGTLNPTPTYAAGNCRYFLGMNSWDCHTTEINDTESLKQNIWVIATNVLIDMVVIAGYLVIGYTVYGGYLYIFSGGDTNKVAGGKKTLTHAFIGLAVVLLANIILNSIRIALLGANGSFSADCVLEDSATCIKPTELVFNALNWIIGIAGAVSLIFVLVGGVGYITSSGDSSKLQKAKNTIIYALIGLAIVALSLTITAFIRNLIESADNATGSVNNTLIAKEYHEK